MPPPPETLSLSSFPLFSFVSSPLSHRANRKLLYVSLTRFLFPSSSCVSHYPISAIFFLPLIRFPVSLIPLVFSPFSYALDFIFFCSPSLANAFLHSAIHCIPIHVIASVCFLFCSNSRSGQHGVSPFVPFVSFAFPTPRSSIVTSSPFMRTVITISGAVLQLEWGFASRRFSKLCSSQSRAPAGTGPSCEGERDKEIY